MHPPHKRGRPARPGGEANGGRTSDRDCHGRGEEGGGEEWGGEGTALGGGPRPRRGPPTPTPRRTTHGGRKRHTSDGVARQRSVVLWPPLPPSEGGSDQRSPARAGHTRSAAAKQIRPDSGTPIQGRVRQNSRQERPTPRERSRQGRSPTTASAEATTPTLATPQPSTWRMPQLGRAPLDGDAATFRPCQTPTDPREHGTACARAVPPESQMVPSELPRW